MLPKNDVTMNQPAKIRSSKADATIQKILQTSLRRVIEQGESGISMTEIAKELGLSRPTLYRYFPTREALLKGVFESVLDDFEQGLRQAIKSNPDPKQRVEVIADFITTRMQDGGVQLFELEPKLIIELIFSSRAMMDSLTFETFAPLFEMSEAVDGKPADQQMIADAFMLLNLSLSLLKAHGEINDLGNFLRKTIRALLTIKRDKATTSGN